MIAPQASAESVPQFAQVAIPIHLRKLFTYRVPVSMRVSIRVGSRVMVQLGTKSMAGYIVALLPRLRTGTSLIESEIKDVQELLDVDPPLTSEVLELTRWVADYYAAPWGEVLRAALPAGINATVEQTVSITEKGQREVLNSAIDDGRLARNPASRVKLPHARSRDKRFLSHEQVAALADAAGEDHLIIRVLAYCGLRFGELAALRIRNVDPLRRRLQIEESATEVDSRMVFGTPKSHQCRSVPVPRSLITDLAAACAGKSPNELLFTAPKGGVLWLRNWRRRVFDPAVEGAGLGQLSPHELRHTAASLAVAAGANVKAVQRTLGHASAAMTLDIYSGLFDDDLDAVADRLDVAAQSARGSARGLSADFLRTDGQLIKLQDWTDTSTAQ